MISKRNNPIGVFDSGLGGLTVVKEMMRVLPSEDIVYFGDTARVPYGSKSREAIIAFSRENTGILLKHKVKMVVVACNSSSSHALEPLKKEFPVPIVGVIHAGAKKAADATRNKKVGVIATTATIASGAYERAIRKCDRSVKVFSRPCPLFVPLAEEGWTNKSVARDIAKEYLMPLKRAGIDTLILGCTHYPLLKKTLQSAMGPGVRLIDSAREVALEVGELLTSMRGTKEIKRAPRHRFMISDRPQEFQKLAKNFLGHRINRISMVKLCSS